MANALKILRGHFVRRRHTTLLVAIVIVFAVRPLIGDVGTGPVLFSLALMALMLVALYSVQVDELVGEREALLVERRRRRIVGGVLAVLAIGERLGSMVVPSPRLYLVGSIGWMCFFAFVTWTELRTVLRPKRVTGETISLSISVYLLLGLTWGIVYSVLFQLQPQAFHFESPVAPASAHMFSVLIYFSLTTLATVGYGDITPVTLQARYVAVAEGITGQLYLA